MIFLTFLSGVVFAGLAIFIIMPKLMFVNQRSKFGFHETIEKLEQAIIEHSWGHRGTWFIHNDLRQKNIDFKPRIANVDLCKANYAADILREEKNRFVAGLMPCSFSVWEDDKGQVYVSGMNTALIGPMFRGLIAKIMGKYVAKEEHSMLKSIVQE